MQDRFKLILFLALFGLLPAGPGAFAQDLVVVATSDFSSGSLASLKVGSDSASVNLINTHGDNAVRSYNGQVFVINRLGADNILVIHNGRIVESGRHAALVNQGGVYSKLFQLQFGEG